MTKTSTLAIATALLLAASPIAMAQDTTAPATTPPLQPNVTTGSEAGAGAGATTDMNAGSTTGAQATPDASQSGDTATGTELDTNTTENVQTPSTQPGTAETNVGMAGTAGTGEMFIQMQDQEMVRVTTLMGADVMSAANEDIGEVNDVVFDLQGQGVAIVVGVGGFLGIGEKNVAVPFERLTVNRENDEMDEVVITLDTTREALNAAPEFQTIEDNATASTTTEGVTPMTNDTGATDTEVEMAPATGSEPSGITPAPAQ